MKCEHDWKYLNGERDKYLEPDGESYTFTGTFVSFWVCRKCGIAKQMEAPILNYKDGKKVVKE